MKNKFLSFLIASMLFLTPAITASANTLLEQNPQTYSIEEINTIENIRNNYHVNLSEEDKNTIEENREFIKSEYGELGISAETMDKLIDKQLSGILLDAYIPEMEPYSTTIINGDYILKVYPDGSVTAKSNFDLNNPRTRGTIKGHNVISKSAYHVKTKTWIQCYAGVSIGTYTVTWTDYTSTVASTIDEIQNEGAFMCTFVSGKVVDNYWEDLKAVMSYNFVLDKVFGTMVDTTYVARYGSIYSN